MINDEKIKPANIFIYVLVFLSCIGGFLFGYDTGIISGALVLISDDIDLNDFEKELVVSVTLVGAMVAASTSGFLCDFLGRRAVVLLSAVTFALGALLMAFAPGFNILVVGRFVIGLGVGASSLTMPVYVSEMSPPEIRGTLVTCINICVTGGQFVACLVAGGLSYTPHGWRYMLGIAALPAVIQFVGFLQMPESPRWLIQHDQHEMAALSLQQIRGQGYLTSELDAIYTSIEAEKREASSSMGGGKSVLACLREDVQLRRAVFMGCCLQAAQQFDGINTIMYYSATILKLAGFTHTSQAIWFSAVVALCNFLGSLVGLYCVDRLGRRPLALASQSMVVLLLGAIALSFHFAEVTSDHISNELYSSSTAQAYPFLDISSHCSKYNYCFDCVQDENCGYCQDIGSAYSTVMNEGSSACVATNDDKDLVNSTYCASSSDFHPNECPNSKLTGWLIFAFLCLYLFAFAPGMGNLPWCINSEIYPTHFRGRGVAIATTVNWSTNLLMSFTFLTLVNLLSKQIAFLMYACIGLVFLYIFHTYLPETKDLSLESAVYMFSDKNWGRKHYVSDPRILYRDIGTQKSPLLAGHDSSHGSSTGGSIPDARDWNVSSSNNRPSSMFSTLSSAIYRRLFEEDSQQFESSDVASRDKFYDSSASRKSHASSRGSITPVHDDRDSESMTINSTTFFREDDDDGSEEGSCGGGDGASVRQDVRNNSILI